MDKIKELEKEFLGNNKEKINDPLVWRKKLMEYGICGLDLPKRVGGKEWPLSDMVEIFSAFGYISLDLRDVPGGGHSLMLDKDQSFDYVLRAVNTMSEYVAIAITEEDAGSDMHAIKTQALKKDDGYVISGTKSYISRLKEATKIIVFAKIKDKSNSNKLTAFIVPSNSKGLSISYLNPVSLKNISWGKLMLNDVFIPKSNLIGEENDGFSLFKNHFTYWRTAMAASAIGSAQRSIDIAKDYLKNRHAFGGPIGRFTHLQQELAIHFSRIYMVRLLLKHTAEKIDQKKDAYFDAAMTKAESVNIAIDAVRWTMQILGANGYIDEVGIGKRYADLLGLSIADGTVDVLRGQVARHLLDEYIYNLTLGRNHGI